MKSTVLWGSAWMFIPARLTERSLESVSRIRSKERDSAGRRGSWISRWTFFASLLSGKFSSAWSASITAIRSFPCQWWTRASPRAAFSFPGSALRTCRYRRAASSRFPSHAATSAIPAAASTAWSFASMRDW